MTNMFLAATFQLKVFPGRVSELHSITLSLPKLIVDLNDKGDGDDDIDDLDDGHCNDNADLDNGNFYGNDSDDYEQYLCCWRI